MNAMSQGSRTISGKVVYLSDTHCARISPIEAQIATLRAIEPYIQQLREREQAAGGFTPELSLAIDCFDSLHEY